MQMLHLKKSAGKIIQYMLGCSIKELVTEGNTKLCCRGFVLALFQSTTANKIDSEHSRDSWYAKLKYYKLQKIKLKFYPVFRLVSDDFRLKVPKIDKTGTLVSC